MKNVSPAHIFTPLLARARRCAALTALLLAAACSGGGSDYVPSANDSTTPAATAAAQANAQSVKIGLLLPLSGQNQALGQAMLNAAQLAMFDIGMTEFTLIPRDTGANPAQAATAAQEAINAGAQILLGPVFAADVRAVKPVAKRAGINVVAFSTDWNIAGDNTFIIGFLPFDQVERIASFAARNNMASLGVIAPTSEYGSTVSQRFNQEAARNGLKVITNIPFPETSPDLTGAVQSLSRSIAPLDAVFMPVGGAQAGQIADLMSAQGMSPSKVRRMGMGLFDDDNLAANRNLDGAWFAAPAPNLRAKFEDRYRANFGNAPPRISTLAYDATALTAVLAKRAQGDGTLASAFNKDALLNPNGFSGIDGIFRFRRDGTAERGLAILQYQNGRIQMLEGAPRTFQAITP